MPQKRNGAEGGARKGDGRRGHGEGAAGGRRNDRLERGAAPLEGRDAARRPDHAAEPTELQPDGGGSGKRRGAKSGYDPPKGKRGRRKRRGRAHKPGRRTRHRPGYGKKDYR